VTSWSEIARTFSDLTTHVLLPTYGLVSLSIVVVGSAITISILLSSQFVMWLLRLQGDRQKRCNAADIGEASSNSLKAFVRDDPLFIRGAQTGRALAVVVLATGVGLAFFAPLSLHIYIKHGFPLLSAPIWLAKALLVTALLEWFWRLSAARRATRFLPLAAVALVAADHVAVQVGNIRAAQPLDTSWVQEVSPSPEFNYVVTWTAASVAAFSQGWVAGMLPGTEENIERRLHDNVRPFEFSDYFLFGQRDLPVMKDAYLRPDFFLYLIADRQN